MDCVNHKQGFYRVTNIEDELIVCGLDYQFHAGHFECEATNKMGKDNATIDLEVRGKSEAITILFLITNSRKGVNNREQYIDFKTLTKRYTLNPIRGCGEGG